jgi:hypothetical protein
MLQEVRQLSREWQVLRPCSCSLLPAGNLLLLFAATQE